MAERIKALLEHLCVNEKAFALLMNAMPATVRLWTMGAGVSLRSYSVPYAAVHSVRAAEINAEGTEAYYAPTEKVLQIERQLKNGS